MIESRYWKQDLLAHARSLSPVKKPQRWTERSVVTFEKELMISFFMVRALLERNKLSKSVRTLKVPVVKYPWNGSDITVLNYADIDELYDFAAGKKTHVSLPFLSNQFVHARAIYAARDKERNWSEVLLCSDYERKTAIYSVAVSEIQKLFQLIASDDVISMTMVYDPELGDYRVTTG